MSSYGVITVTYLVAVARTVEFLGLIHVYTLQVHTDGCLETPE